MRVRLRAPGGQHTAELADDATVGDLKATVFDKTGVAPAAQELKAGFPPKKIEGDDGTSLASVGVTNGESITVTEVASAAGAAPSAAPSPPQISAMDEDEALARAIAASLEDSGNAPASVARRPRTEAVRVVIDSDNSCLFNAVGYVMRRSLREAPGLRRVIADVVSGDEFTYNEGFLGKPNAEYCAWIQDPKHWGGAVELSILAKHFGREIAAYDIQTERCDVYGQGEAYEERLVRVVRPDGMVLHYEGEAGSEHTVRIEMPDGEVQYHEGAKNEERLCAEQRMRNAGQRIHDQIFRQSNPLFRCRLNECAQCNG